jgi:hypothetical protein
VVATKKTRTKKNIYSERVRMTRAAAIRAFCVECMNFQVGEVNKCPAEHCPLWPFRKGVGEETTKVLLLGPSDYDS